MFLSISHIFLAVLVLLVSVCYRRSRNFKEKLWWVPVIPGYPILGNALEFRDSTKTLERMNHYMLKYQGLCCFTLLFRPLILISDAKFCEWLLSSTTILTKSKDYQFLYNWLEGGMLISTGSEWRKSRKILTPAFHFAILEQFVEVFEKPTAIFLDCLRKQMHNEAINVHPLIVNYTLDIICQTAMGVDLKVQKESQNDYVAAVDAMCKTVVERAFNPLKSFDITYRLSPDYYREMRNVKLLHSVSNAVIDKRRKEMESEKDNVEIVNDDGTKRKMAFLDLLLKSRDEHGQPLSQEFIRREVDTFMFAGHDTTASAISFIFFCLANHPDEQNQVLNEIKEVLGEGQKITYKELQEMKYLEMVIKESLRLYPSVPFYSRQTTEDVLYEDGKVIPQGITLIVSSYAIHRNPHVYDQPDKFIPSRFLNLESKPFTYLPFSAGPRNCIGQKFAMLLIKFALINVLSNFEILPSNPSCEVVLSAESVLKAHNGVNIRLKSRT
nr:cytochrome P450 CYP4BQ1 [Dendroctonus rhizophagus]